MPYNVEYQNELAQAAALLREAAALATEPTLKTFLTKRADAFLSNDYYDSDVAWMELKGAIEPTIGPYEVYEDEWFNDKAAFESFITVQDEAESAKLQKFAASCRTSKITCRSIRSTRNPKLGGSAPIVVVNEIYAAGDANHGVQTAAFNLPNDERVVEREGQQARHAEERAGREVRQDADADLEGRAGRRPIRRTLSFEAFFTHILVHELMHGLGPHNITVGGRQTTVRQELKETYSALEEAKADISSLFAIQYHDRQGRAAEDRSSARCTRRFWRRPSGRSGSASTRRTVAASPIQLNYLMDKGGVDGPRRRDVRRRPGQGQGSASPA